MLGTDLTPFLNTDHFASTVVWGAVTGKGILDAPGSVLAGGDVMSTEYMVTCPAADFGAAKYGDPITVGGVSFTVRENRPIDDGAFVEITLSKV